MPSIVKVTNLSNKMELYIRINDRGPFVNNRIIDLSKEAAIKLNIFRKGTENVRVQLLDTGPHLLAKKFLEQKYLEEYSKNLEPVRDKDAKDKKYFFLQLGAFENKQNAETFLIKIKDKLSYDFEAYSSIFIKDTIINLFKVLLGPYEVEHKAITDAKKLSDLGIETIIILDKG